MSSNSVAQRKLNTKLKQHVIDIEDYGVSINLIPTNINLSLSLYHRFSLLNELFGHIATSDFVFNHGFESCQILWVAFPRQMWFFFIVIYLGL